MTPSAVSVAERDSLHAFPAKMLAAGVTLKAAQPIAVRAGTAILGTVTRAQLRTVAPSLHMSGVGRRGAAVGITAASSGASGIVKATGPVHLLERRTKAHVIEPRLTAKLGETAPDRTARRARRPALKIGDRYARWARHPGTKGQYPFAKGIAKGLPPARDAMAATMIRATNQALR